MSEDYTSLTHVCSLVTNERLNKALTDWFKEEYTFTRWEYVGDTGKGDAYHSEVIRIKIYGVNNNGKENYAQVVLKYMPESISRKLKFRAYDFYKNEIGFYEVVLPELLRFQSTKNVKEPFDNYAKLVFAQSDGSNDVICLEDANLHGFRGAVRQEGIDLDHCKIIMKVFARFHSLSFAMKDQEPEKFEKLRNAIFETYYDERLWDWYTEFWKRISGIAIDAVEKEYPNSIYLEKVKQFAVPERYQDMINAATKTVETGVISHGDCWTNNFLFKYVNGHPVDAKLIDFQITRCASPVLDISFIICACTSQDLRDKYYDELLKLYHDTLSDHIRELGSDPDKLYSWELFMAEIKKYSYFGLAFSFESTPFIVLAPEDAVNMEMEGDEKLNINDVWRVGNFKTKEGRLREANNVKHCVDRGYI
ncbi:unnamed protein product [Arctia plantaginis]|uniref:CHK kinase-like domain-containing protein n=1 Tax=Arctia plantaginis TaxID=874455 RepID=A0A8S0Z288_ARCPL|nr:unnamed protein product [Arctia plantaginis]